MIHLKQPDIRPVKENGQLYILMEDFTYNGITVPKGFRYDGATGAKFLFGKDGIHRAATLLHDYLYEIKGKLPSGAEFNRLYVDKIFKDMLKEYGVKSWHVFLAYAAVRLLGGIYWARDKK